MYIFQGEQIFSNYTVVCSDPDARYMDVSCLDKLVDNTRWNEQSIAPFMYPHEYITAEGSMNGNMVGNWGGRASVEIFTDTVTPIGQSVNVSITTHNPCPLAEVIHCRTHGYINGQWVVIEDDEHILPAFGDYTGNYSIDNDYDMLKFSVYMDCDEQYLGAPFGISQLKVYVGSLIDDGFTACKIDEQIDFENVITSSLWINGLGTISFDRSKYFELYDDYGQQFGRWLIDTYQELYDGTYQLTAYDCTGELTSRVTRGDWFEGHCPRDAVRNLYTYTNRHNWRTVEGLAKMNSMMELADDTQYRLKGHIPWGTSLKDAVAKIALSIGKYAKVNRAGKLVMNDFPSDTDPIKVIGADVEVYGRKVSEAKRGVDRIIVQSATFNKWRTDTSSAHYMRRYTAETHSSGMDARFTAGDFFRKYNNTDEDEIYKYCIYDGTWHNTHTLDGDGGASGKFTAELIDSNCPSPLPSDTQRMYFKQTALWNSVGSDHLYLRGMWTDAPTRDIWSDWWSYPSRQSSDDEFNEDWSTKTIDLMVQTQPSYSPNTYSMAELAQSLYYLFRDNYTVTTTILPNQGIETGDRVQIDAHEGVVTGITTDLGKGGVQTLTVLCHTPTN